MTAAGGHYVIRSDKFTSSDGTPPARLTPVENGGFFKIRSGPI
jgi:hypothetical protein